MAYRVDLIDEETLEVVKTGKGATKEEAMTDAGFYYQPGFDANVYEISEPKTQLSGCGVHSFYVD